MIRFALAAAFAVLATLPTHAAVEVQEVESPGGFTAWLVEEHSIPFAAVEFRFRGGTVLDLPDKRGAVNLMTGLLEEGSGDMDARAFAEARENLATRISFDASSDAVSVSFRFLSENRDASAALLRQALTEPAFAEDAIERVREQVLSNIRSEASDPNAIARETFYRLAYPDHPYGEPGSGTLESVARLTRADVLDAHRRAIAKERVFVAAVGDITPQQLSQLMDTVLGDLRQEGAPFPPAAEYQLEPGITIVPFDTPQSVALFGHEGLERQDDDFLTAYVVNEIFGGTGLESRLKEEVRVKRGLTYGIGAYLIARDYGELLMGQVATANARMAETVDVLRGEWERIAATGVTDDELDAAKVFLTGAYPLRFDSNASIAQILVGMQLDGMPIDYIRTRNEQVEAITFDEAYRIARQIYRPEDLHIVIVGQPEGIEVSN